MDVKSDLKKKRMCIAIAKYYVQIFHIFNAIAHTINPVYTWKDKFGSTVKVDYEHRNEIPKDIQPTISKVNLCSSRINALMTDKALLDKTGNEVIEINAKFCNLNKDANNLSSEPGIPELEVLYYDEYDYNTGKFSTMSDKMSKEYNKDLNSSFYTLFTGDDKLPSDIKKFGEIPLRDYKKINQCSKDGAFRKTYNGTLKEKLFKEYVDNIKNMMKNTEDNQTALLAIIDQLFVFVKDPQDPNKKLIVINPKLDNKLLSKLITDTRSIIIKLYSTCEKDFFKGLQLFEAIVEKQIIDTSAAQIKRLQENVEETISLEPDESSPIVNEVLGKQESKSPVSSGLEDTISPEPPAPEAAAAPEARAPEAAAAAAPAAEARSTRSTRAAGSKSTRSKKQEHQKQQQVLQYNYLYTSLISLLKYVFLPIALIILFVSFSSSSIDVIELKTSFVSFVCRFSSLSHPSFASCHLFIIVLCFKAIPLIPTCILFNSVSFSHTLLSFTYIIFRLVSVQ